MPQSNRPVSGVSALLISCIASLMLVACGGGGSETDSNNRSGSSISSATSVNGASLQLEQEPNAPQLTGNTATDGFNWFNYRRQQAGLPVVSRNALVDQAAQAHSDYEKVNNTITHDETRGNPGYTGATLQERLTAAGYAFTQNRFSYGEVLSATGDTSGFHAAEDLIGAIYHRFVALEPMFKEAGAGVATVPGGYTYFTMDFAANGLGAGLGRGGFITYPKDNQEHVPMGFFTDRETPDPVPEQNEVGYPVSIHADITATVTAQSFTVKPRGGAPLAIKLLSHANDSETPPSAVAIIPLGVLASQTTYDVQFIGTVDGVPVSRSWSFKTQ